MRELKSFKALGRTVVRSLLSATLVCSVMAPQVIFACSCASPSLENRYEGSDNVFTARITGGEATSDRVGNSPKLKIYFEVTETFKGAIPFGHFTSHADGSSCGISLQVGVEYLIFAPDTGRIGLCSGIVAVSGVPHQGEAIGAKYAGALRAFTAGQNDSLAEPWLFAEHQGICRLSGRFSYGDSRWPASIGVTHWMRVPKSVSPSPDRPNLKAGFTEMSIRVPGREDLANFPLTLTVGDSDYVAQWSKEEYSGARYILRTDDAPRLIAELVSASVLRLKSSHPTHGQIEAEAPLINAGDSVAKMHTCITSEVDDQKQ